MAEDFARDHGRSVISDALTSQLKHSRGDNGSNNLSLDQFAYSSRCINETKLKFSKREDSDAFGLAKIQSKYFDLTPDPEDLGDLTPDPEDLGDLTPDPEDIGEDPVDWDSPEMTVKPAVVPNGIRPPLFDLPGKSNAKSMDIRTVQQKSGQSSKQEEKCDEGLTPPRTVLFDPAEVKLNWTFKLPVGSGLVNAGFTCYLNSSLQALIHCPPFINWLLKEPHVQQSERGCDCLICAMAKTVRTSYYNKGSQIKPTLILQKLRVISKTLKSDKQEDAHEFLRSLLSGLQLTYLKMKSAEKLDVRSQETTPIDQIFGGYIRSQVLCTRCSRKSNTYDHFQDLILDIRAADSLKEALDQYFKKEILQHGSGYKCSRCRMVVQASKKFSIEKAPNVLIIQLKRFENVFRKIGRPVAFYQELDLTQYSSWADDQKRMEPPPQRLRYSLNGIVVHEGQSLAYGHYVASAKACDGVFYHFNDSSVYPTSFDRIKNFPAYLLFYVRCPDGTFKQPNGVSAPFRAADAPKHPVTVDHSLALFSTPSPAKRPAVGPVFPPSPNGAVAGSQLNHVYGPRTPQQHQRFIGPQLPPGFQNRSWDSNPASMSAPPTPKPIKAHAAVGTSPQSEPVVRPTVPAFGPLPSSNGKLGTAVNALGVRPKPAAAAALGPSLQQHRSPGGADPSSSKRMILVPYDEEDDDDDAGGGGVVKTKSSSSPSPPGTPENSDADAPPSTSGPAGQVVLSTHKNNNWVIDDEKHRTNRSDTSADSVSSTSGKWKTAANVPRPSSGKKKGASGASSLSASERTTDSPAVSGNWEQSEMAPDATPFKKGAKLEAPKKELTTFKEEMETPEVEAKTKKGLPSAKSKAPEPALSSSSSESSDEEEKTILASSSSSSAKKRRVVGNGNGSRKDKSPPLSSVVVVPPPSASPSLTSSKASSAASSRASSAARADARRSSAERERGRNGDGGDDRVEREEQGSGRSRDGGDRRSIPSSAASSGDERDRTSSLHGFGNQVLSWNGGPNSLDTQLDRERRLMDERRRKEREYDDDFDRGKEKKRKKPRDASRNGDDASVNRFDEFARGQRERGRVRERDWGGTDHRSRSRSHSRSSSSHSHKRGDWDRDRHYRPHDHDRHHHHGGHNGHRRHGSSSGYGSGGSGWGYNDDHDHGHGRRKSDSRHLPEHYRSKNRTYW